MLKLLLVASILAAAAAVSHPPFEVIYEWKTINYNWPSHRDEKQAVTTKKYIAANNGIAGIKLWKNKLYLTTPRWKNGIPVTLAVTSATPVNGNRSPRLDPYPNWKMQKQGNCNAFQLVQSMEIDPLGRMWVIDAGRSEVKNANPIVKCPPRLVILDLENNGKVLGSYVFPEKVASKKTSFLDDIVLDHEDGGWAYITLHDTVEPGLIVYSLANNTSWKFTDDKSMRAQAEAIKFTLNGLRWTTPFDVDGIALSPPGPNRQVYYSPLSSFHLYSIPTSALKNSRLKHIGPFVTDLGRKKVRKDGMVMTNQNSLYMTLTSESGVGEWNTVSHPSFSTGFRTLVSDRNRMQWPDTVGIDQNGSFWVVSNNQQFYLTNQTNITRVNYRVWRSDIRQKNYQYYKNGSAPKLPSLHNAPICATTFAID